MYPNHSYYKPLRLFYSIDQNDKVLTLSWIIVTSRAMTGCRVFSRVESWRLIPNTQPLILARYHCYKPCPLCVGNGKAYGVVKRVNNKIWLSCTYIVMTLCGITEVSTKDSGF